MSTALQTIEPDESTLTTDSHPPARNAETLRPVSGPMASSSTPGDAEAGTVLSSPPLILDAAQLTIDGFGGKKRSRRDISSGAGFQTG